MKDLFKDININLEDIKPIEFEEKGIIIESSCEEQFNDLSKRIDKMLNKKILSELLDNMEAEEFIYVIRSREFQDFVYCNPNGKYINFNHDYYKKWKIKKKIGDF